MFMGTERPFGKTERSGDDGGEGNTTMCMCFVPRPVRLEVAETVNCRLYTVCFTPFLKKAFCFPQPPQIMPTDYRGCRRGALWAAGPASLLAPLRSLVCGNQWRVGRQRVCPAGPLRLLLTEDGRRRWFLI